MGVGLSIIVPVFNTHGYVSSCLDSILAQRLDDFEVICIDDGSTDGSRSILASYESSDPRIRVIDQVHAGLSAARNAGLEHAQGTYVGFVDSDDWIDPEMFSTMLDRAHRTDADIVVCHHQEYDESTGTFSPQQVRGRPPGPLETFTNTELKPHVFRLNTAAWDKIYRRSFISSHGLAFPNQLCFEEVYFVVSAFLMSRSTSFIDRPLYCYRRHRRGSITSTTGRHIADIIPILDLLRERISDTRDAELKLDFERYAFEFYLRHLDLIDPTLRPWYFKQIKRRIASGALGDLARNRELDPSDRIRSEMIRRRSYRSYRIADRILQERVRIDRMVGACAQVLMNLSPRTYRLITSSPEHKKTHPDIEATRDR